MYTEGPEGKKRATTKSRLVKTGRKKIHKNETVEGGGVNEVGGGGVVYIGT